MIESSPPEHGVFREEFTVPENAIDENGHVNNVVYLQWMQDVATKHFHSVIEPKFFKALGYAWVARSHQIEYLQPSFAGDRLEILTWVENFSRVRSLRRYQFRRCKDQQMLVRGETDWVLVNAATGRPSAIPDSIKQAFGGF